MWCNWMMNLHCCRLWVNGLDDLSFDLVSSSATNMPRYVYPGIVWPRYCLARVLSYLCSEPQSDHWCIVWRRPFKNRYLWLGDVHLHAAVHSRCLTIAVYQQQMFEVVVLWSDIHVVTDHRAFVVLEISCVSLWIAALCYIVNCSKAVKTRSESSLLCRLSV